MPYNGKERGRSRTDGRRGRRTRARSDLPIWLKGHSLTLGCGGGTDAGDGRMRFLLVLMSGLPGSGKSAIADELGRRLPACVVSVDPIEAAIIRSGIAQSFETGVAAYEVGATVAAHQLAFGFNVVADAANYLEVGRDVWRRARARQAFP